MSVLELDLSAAFLVAVLLIWFMIAYQFILTVFGFLNQLRARKEQAEADATAVEYPSCTILIPAHNEEMVIGQTVEAMRALVYPPDRLRIVVINDGSTDRTAEIVQRIADIDGRVHLFTVPPGEGGKGKSRALNLGLASVTTDIVAVYDADNTPAPDALRYLAARLAADGSLGGAIGKFRTANKDVNLLTRFINIETLSFQSILQAGRWRMHRIATLPGTNLVLRTDLLRDLGGWDERALTEDSELSIRIYQRGYAIAFVPYAITYEQEPQSLRVFLRQRTRWVQGNNYVLGKFLRQIPAFVNKRLAIDLLYTLSLYYIFFFAIIISDILFVLGALNLVSMVLPGPYTLVWIMAFFLFVLEIFLALSYDREDRPGNLGLIVLMYFTYCQVWIVIVLRAIYRDVIRKEKRVWDKTERFAPVAAREVPHEV
jgi:cellulose synthase/poly-beta-1,6-N-acetylglucosamine synthase-like glycosyltransferase